MSASAPSFTSPTAVIGKTIVIKGDIHSEEPLTIQGRVEGLIEIGEHLLTVARGGDVKAQITARSVGVQGHVEGQVLAAETVHIHAGAEFVGDIYAASLIVEEGGYIKGNIDLTRKPADSSSRLSDAVPTSES
jgi:cytoskeletal protein CcmA (bactofilin family)